MKANPELFLLEADLRDLEQLQNMEDSASAAFVGEVQGQNGKRNFSIRS
jgi:hypothetical protein